MRSPLRRALAVAALALLLLPGALPLAGADHVYSHRYVVYGRVVDEAGRPLVNEQVEVGVDPVVEVEGLCAEQPGTGTDAWEATTTRTRTNEFGEFMYCFHTHRLPRATDGEVHVKVAGQELSQTVDTKFRRNFVPVTVTGAEGQADAAAFESTYLVAGRVWYAASSKSVERVVVYGDTLQDEPVTITYTPANGEPVTEETRTNGYGDFAVRLPVTEAMGPGTVTVEAAGETFSFDADMTYRATDADLRVPEPGGFWKYVTRYGMLVLLVAVVAGGAWFALRGGGEGAKKAAKKGKKAR